MDTTVFVTRSQLFRDHLLGLLAICVAILSLGVAEPAWARAPLFDRHELNVVVSPDQLTFIYTFYLAQSTIEAKFLAAYDDNENGVLDEPEREMFLQSHAEEIVRAFHIMVNGEERTTFDVKIDQLRNNMYAMRFDLGQPVRPDGNGEILLTYENPLGIEMPLRAAWTNTPNIVRVANNFSDAKAQFRDPFGGMANFEKPKFPFLYLTYALGDNQLLADVAAQTEHYIDVLPGKEYPEDLIFRPSGLQAAAMMIEAQLGSMPTRVQELAAWFLALLVGTGSMVLVGLRKTLQERRSMVLLLVPVEIGSLSLLLVGVVLAAVAGDSIPFRDELPSSLVALAAVIAIAGLTLGTIEWRDGKTGPPWWFPYSEAPLFLAAGLVLGQRGEFVSGYVIAALVAIIATESAVLGLFIGKWNDVELNEGRKIFGRYARIGRACCLLVTIAVLTITFRL